MRFVTFSRKNQQRIGLIGPQEQIIDLAEVNRRYLKGGNQTFLASMQAFIDAGPKAVAVARKAEKYVAGKTADEQKKLVGTGALVKPNQAKILAPIPNPKKNVVMLGINYREHVDEGARARELEIKYPEWPVFFTKPATSVIGNLGKVVNHKVTTKLDWEVELAVVIGKKRPGYSQRKSLRLRVWLHRLSRHDRPRAAAPAWPMVQGQIPRHLLPDGPLDRSQERSPRPAASAAYLPG